MPDVVRAYIYVGIYEHTHAGDTGKIIFGIEQRQALVRRHETGRGRWKGEGEHKNTKIKKKAARGEDEQCRLVDKGRRWIK